MTPDGALDITAEEMAAYRAQAASEQPADALAFLSPERFASIEAILAAEAMESEDDGEPADPSTSSRPLPTIRKYCLSCSGTSNEVKLCVSTRCPLWPFRFGARPDAETRAGLDPEQMIHPQEGRETWDDTKGLSPLKMIRRKCVDCSGNSPTAVANCKLESCPLWPLRFGRPAHKRGTPEQRAAAAERMRLMWRKPDPAD